MVVRIRLVPVGKKSQCSYQIRVIDSRRARESGNYLEHLGYWNPGQKKLELNQEAYQKWLQLGAQPTDSLNLRYQKLAIINNLENLPLNRIKIELSESNFKVKDLKKKLKENNYWLIKGALLDKWEKGLVEKIFKKNNRFRIGKIFFRTNKPGIVKPLDEKEEVSLSPGSFNFEFSIVLPKEDKSSRINYTTKNGPVCVLEPKK